MNEQKSTSAKSAELLNSFLSRMLLIRRFEESAAQAYGLRKIGGFLHLYIGQEAVAVGTISALDLSKDYVLTAYRDHGHALACGLEPNALMAELFGKETGCSKGKGGSMHFFSAKRHFLGGNGIVGSQIPVATGVALACKYQKNGGVAVCFFGDGAIHQGTFHESLNMAKIWNLPIVYICENNQYGMGTDFRRVSAVTDFSSLGASYGITGKQVNGMDVIQVYEAAADAAARARGEQTPVLLEICTYRYKGHSMSDPGKYRSKEEVEEYKAQDPILLLKKIMTEDGRLTEESFKEIDVQARDECRKAVDFAEKSSPPSLQSRFEDVLA